MYGKIKDHLCTALENLKQAGLYKEERIIESPQQAAIQVKGKEVLNFCANNYLGLSNHPRLIEGAKKMMDRRGFGMSSVMHSTTLLSLTVYVSARLSAIATPMPIWKNSRSVCRKHRHSVSASSVLTAYSLWTAM